MTRLPKAKSRSADSPLWQTAHLSSGVSARDSQCPARVLKATLRHPHGTWGAGGNGWDLKRVLLIVLGLMKSFVSDPGVWRLQTAKFYYLFMKSIYKFLLWWYIQTLHGSWYPHFQYFNMMEFQIDSCYILSLYHPSVFLVTIFISFETLRFMLDYFFLDLVH